MLSREPGKALLMALVLTAGLAVPLLGPAAAPALAQSPAIQVVKSSTATSVIGEGQVVPYDFLVTNAGDVTLSGITVSDPNCTSAIVGPTGDTNPADGNLQTTETWTYTCTHTATLAEMDAGGNLHNTVTADSAQSAPDTDSHDIPIIQNPVINVEKSSTTTAITTAGQVVPYDFAVTNAGNVTLHGVTVSDPNCTSAIVGPSETWTYTCTHTVTQAEIDGGGYLANTVTADSTESAPDTDDYYIPITQNPAIQVVKSSTTTAITTAAQVVPYDFVVTNAGNVTLSGITVSDPNCTSAIVGPTGDTSPDSKLQLTETWTYTCNHTVTQAEIDGGGNLHNTVTADSTESAPDTDDYDIPITQNLAIQVVKSSTTTAITTAGQVVPYDFVVTNAGNVTLSGITVSDPNCTSAIVGPTGDTSPDSKLQLTETWTYTCNHTVTPAEIDGGGNLSNTVTADSAESAPDTDSHDIPITLGSITIVKQADPEGAQEFDFAAGDLGDFSLTDDGTPANTKEFTDVIAGTYAVTETIPAGWRLTDIVCDDADTTWDVDTASALIDLDPGEEITCTFSNKSYVMYLPLILRNW
jgi:hypothetical protein